ncbi:hypothetical protein MHYP_G00201420 [Metynnis hypsauchen]
MREQPAAYLSRTGKRGAGGTGLAQAAGTTGPPTLEGIREGLREGMGVYPLSASQEEQNDGQKWKEGRSDGEAEDCEMG